LKGRSDQEERTLFFNLGFMTVKPTPGLQQWLPEPLKAEVPADRLVVVSDADIGMIHDMALYRQSRVKLEDKMKKVDGKAFFNVEALPEGSVLVFPVALKPDPGQTWQPFDGLPSQDLYFGGLESVGFGRCSVTLMSCAGAKPAAEVA
jgi:CRISPR-associated protein Cmr4